MSILDVTRLSDEDLRAALFDAMVERLDALAREDPSIAVVNRMPTAFVVSRRNNLLTLSQGIGVRLLHGGLKRQDQREKPRTFNVGRATIQSRLALTPNGLEGTPDEIIERIVAMFLEGSATGQARGPAGIESVRKTQPTTLPPAQKRPAAPRPTLRESPSATRSAGKESRPAPGTPQNRPSISAIREAMLERRAPSAGSTREPGLGGPRTVRERQTMPVDVTAESTPAPQMAHKPRDAEAAPPRSAPIREGTSPSLRTYQLMLETARQALDQAKAPSGGTSYFLISAAVFVAMTSEACFNDLGSRVIPFWFQLQRLDAREKAEVLNLEMFNEPVDWSVRPFQSVAAALGFRHALTQAQAETVSPEQVPGIDRAQHDVSRTRRPAWSEYCDVATIEQWITDVRLVVEHFSRAVQSRQRA